MNTDWIEREREVLYEMLGTLMKLDYKTAMFNQMKADGENPSRDKINKLKQEYSALKRILWLWNNNRTT